jgi:hypothetical protein
MKIFIFRRALELTLLPIFLRTVLREQTATSTVRVDARYALAVKAF